MCIAFGLEPDDCIATSAKSGLGVHNILPTIARRVPPPRGQPAGQCRARVVDSWFDEHRGVVCLIQAVGGTLTEGQRITTFASVRESKDIDSRSDFSVQEIGILTPTPLRTSSLRTGQVQCVTWRGVCGE